MRTVSCASCATPPGRAVGETGGRTVDQPARRLCHCVTEVDRARPRHENPQRIYQQRQFSRSVSMTSISLARTCAAIASACALGAQAAPAYHLVDLGPNSLALGVNAHG